MNMAPEDESLSHESEALQWIVGRAQTCPKIGSDEIRSLIATDDLRVAEFLTSVPRP
jgi:hypothetical protein